MNSEYEYILGEIDEIVDNYDGGVLTFLEN